MLVLTVLKGPDKGDELELPDQQPQQIGRSSECLQLSDTAISRRHAELTPDGDEWYISDLQSANGTFLNGVKLQKPRRLKRGDQIRVGNTVLMFGRKRGPAKEPAPQQAARASGEDKMESHVEASVDPTAHADVMALGDPAEAQAVQLKVLYQMTHLVGTAGSGKKTFLEEVMKVIFENFHCDRGVILLSGERDEPEPVVTQHREEPPDHETDRETISRTIVRHVLKERMGVLSKNAMSDERFSSDSVQQVGIRSAICVPILTEDRSFGAIYVDSLIANYTFSEDQLRLLAAIGRQVGLALNNAELYNQRVQQERLAAVGQTVASLSHSIKNIIQGLRGGAEVVELGFRKNDMSVVQNGWQIVARNLHRIQNLTMNMLTFSKQRSPEFELTDVPRLLQEIVELVQRQFDEKEVMLVTDVDEEMPQIALDASGVHQIVLNLLTNALEASDGESGPVTLRAQYRQEKESLLIQVADQGEGMDETAKENLFQPFYSTKGFKGTGLGLVVTKKIVDEHGGRVKVESAPGEGTEITLKLPAKPAGEGDTAIDDRQKTDTATPPAEDSP